jgi:hypothetical protein
MSSPEQIHGHDHVIQWGTADGAHHIWSADPHGTTDNGMPQRIENAGKSSAFVQSKVLPDLQIDGNDPHSAPQESGFMHYVNGAAAVISDVAIGAVDEAIHHPVELVGTALTGLAIGTAAAVVAPEVAIGAAVLGAGYGAYQLATHVGGWINAADVVSNTQDHTTAQVKTAHEYLQDLGGGAARLGAGAIGSLGGAPLAGAISDFISASAVDAVTPEATIGVAKEAVTTEAKAAASDLGLTSAERAAMTPEQFSALQESVARNQSIFRAAQERGEVIPSVKQSYSVHFEKVGPEGRLVPTLENPAGVQLQEGGWVATRLNADGTPNIENGMVNQWTPKAKDIAKQYLVTPEQLASESDFIGRTNTSAPPVHMVQLDAPMDFQTRWGTMHADAGDWLSNYDFNATAGHPGNDFARVTAQSYQQTYRPVAPQD